MKSLLNLLLVAAACLLAYMCYERIQVPIQYNEAVAKREAVIIQRLKDIRTLQENHRDKYQTYCASWDELINFAKNDVVPIVIKVGSLTDQQLADGLNEQKAWMYLCDPKKYKKEIDKFGLSKETFSRDTMYVNVLQNDSAISSRPDFNIDNIKFIPVKNLETGVVEHLSDTIELNLGEITTASGYKMALFEARVPYESYLSDLNEQETANKIEDKKQQDKFPGLQVGDATTANNNAGNWE